MSAIRNLTAVALLALVVTPFTSAIFSDCICAVVTASTGGSATQRSCAVDPCDRSKIRKTNGDITNLVVSNTPCDTSSGENKISVLVGKQEVSESGSSRTTGECSEVCMSRNGKNVFRINPTGSRDLDRFDCGRVVPGLMGQPDTYPDALPLSILDMSLAPPIVPEGVVILPPNPLEPLLMNVTMNSTIVVPETAPPPPPVVFTPIAAPAAEADASTDTAPAVRPRSGVLACVALILLSGLFL